MCLLLSDATTNQGSLSNPLASISTLYGFNVKLGQGAITTSSTNRDLVESALLLTPSNNTACAACDDSDGGVGPSATNNYLCSHHLIKLTTPTYDGYMRRRHPLLFSDSDVSRKSRRSMRSRPVYKTEVVEVENGVHKVVTKQSRLASAVRAS